MKLVTWNCCRGAYERKAPLLDALGADVTVLQECARPARQSDTLLWLGDNPRQGIAVAARNGYTLSALPTRRGVPKFVYPIEVARRRERFTLFAVWSKAGQKYRYVMAVVKALRMYRALFDAAPAVVIGDLNTNAIWDHVHPTRFNHSALLALLDELGLVSAYHAFHAEPHGAETRPTCYLLWKESRPYHLDYCFVPQRWMPRVRDVHVGSFADWKAHSDHRPLAVDIAEPPVRRRRSVVRYTGAPS